MVKIELLSSHATHASTARKGGMGRQLPIALKPSSTETRAGLHLGESEVV